MEEIFDKCKRYLLTSVLIIILFIPILIHADSGFDSSYDSGGGGFSSSSSSSSYDSDSSGGEFDLPTFLSICYSGLGLFLYFFTCSKFFKKDNSDFEYPTWYTVLYWIVYIISVGLLFGLGILFFHYSIIAFIAYFLIGNERFTGPNDTFLIKYTLGYWGLYFISVLLIFGMMVFIITLFLGIPTMLISLNATIKARNQGKKELKGLSTMTDEAIYIRLGKDFDIERFKQEVFENYKNIQIAWMNRDVEPVRNLLSDQIFSMYRTQLATLTAKNQKNMMEDITYVRCDITRVVKTAKKIEIEVLLQVTCRDYIVDKDNKVVRGNKHLINDYIYKLVFVKSLKESELKICPNCGAKLENATSDRCEHCNTVIAKESTRFAMTDKKMLRQKVVK